jgi:hypothetical protein
METTKTIKFSSGVIQCSFENVCSDEYNLLYWAYFVPNEFNKKVIHVIGEAGFDTECEKDKIAFDYYPETDEVLCKITRIRITVVLEDIFNQYKDHIVYRYQDEDICINSFENKEENCALPWIRYPRTKDGVLIPVLIEKIFGHVPSKIVFQSEICDSWIKARE